MRPWAVSKYFVDKGYDVTVIAAAPHHMSGITDKTLGSKIFNSFEIDGIKIIKVYSYSNYRESKLSRILYYLIYSTLAMFVAITVRKPDFIIATTPPIFLLIPGYIVSKLKRKRFVVEVRDAWLEFAIARKLVPKILIKPLMKLQSFMFKKANHIVSVTPGIKKIVDEYTGNPDKNLLVMNGYEEDVNVWTAENEAEAKVLAEEYNLKDKFVVIYTGTLGMARDQHVFGKTAKYLKEYKDIIFLFVGEGEKKQELVDYCNENRLDNCIFVPLRPRTMMPLFMHISDVGINSIRRNDALESSLSNKVLDYLGNGLPVVWAGEGDTSELLECCEGGFAVEPEDERAMGEALLALYQDPELKRQMAQKGKDYILKNFTRQKTMQNIDPILI